MVRSADRHYTKHCVARILPAAIIETGTFRGTTTEYMAETGLPLYSVEGLARNYGFSRARLWRKRNVHLYHGDSREVLRRLFAGKLRNLGDHTVFAYLDAHWNADLPLREELEIIFDHCPAAVVMIDDFQVPDDPGYQYDDYGSGKSLSPVYIEPVLSAYDLEAYYPAIRSSEETGAKRGCVVLGNEYIPGSSLRELPLLRRRAEESDSGAGKRVPPITTHCPRLAELPPPPEGKTGWAWTLEAPPLPPTRPEELFKNCQETLWSRRSLQIRRRLINHGRQPQTSHSTHRFHLSYIAWQAASNTAMPTKRNVSIRGSQQAFVSSA